MYHSCILQVAICCGTPMVKHRKIIFYRKHRERQLSNLTGEKLADTEMKDVLQCIKFLTDSKNSTELEV